MPLSCALFFVLELPLNRARGHPICLHPGVAGVFLPALLALTRYDC